LRATTQPVSSSAARPNTAQHIKIRKPKISINQRSLDTSLCRGHRNAECKRALSNAALSTCNCDGPR
jgi:hypothetical protein